MSDNQEIKALQNIFTKHKVEINFSATNSLAQNKEYRSVEFKLEKHIFSFYVDDEYDDIKYNNSLLNFCLVLRELESYKDTKDYLSWCQERYFNPKNERVIINFRNLATIYRKVENIIGEINSQISNWDFEMNSGVASELRKKLIYK